MGKHIGKSVKRVEDPRFIQGQGKYVANLKLPNMAHVAVLRSPHAHAKIKSINTDAAKAIDGVIDVFIGQDLIDGGVGKMPVIWQVPDNKIPDRWPLVPVHRQQHRDLLQLQQQHYHQHGAPCLEPAATDPESCYRVLAK